jgi:hypothetical protein
MLAIGLGAVCVPQPFCGAQKSVSDLPPFAASSHGLYVSCAPQITMTATSPLQVFFQVIPEAGAMARRTLPRKQPSMLAMMAPELTPSAKMRCMSTQ